MPSAYHVQNDGQTEVLNKCLEHYLCAFVMDWPSRWFRFLAWAELCYNTTFHSSIIMTPFEAVFGKPPPSIPSYFTNSSSIEAVDTLLRDREELFSAMRGHMLRAQERMKFHADKKRSYKVLEVGKYCYIRLQPHKQTSLAGQLYTNLRKRYYGPFKIIKRVGIISYKLELPPAVTIHPIFHI